jgi:hypothetical protein
LRVEEKESVETDDSHPHREVQLVAEEVWRFNRDAKTDDERWLSSTAAAPEPVVEADILLEDEVASGPGLPYLGDTATVNIYLDTASLDRSGVAAIAAHIASRKGPTPVKLHFPVGEREIIVETGAQRRVVFSPDLREALLAVPGVREVTLDRGSG